MNSVATDCTAWLRSSIRLLLEDKIRKLRPIVLLPELLKVVGGDVVVGLLLSQLYRCSETYSQKGKDKKTIERDGFRWIAKTHAEFQNETGLTRKQQLRASALLRRLGIIETRVMHFNGIPMNHWRLNLEKLNVLLAVPKRDT